ncbi:MAG: isoleucine--tRNA ligase [Oscillospiraceae bacterium]|nr:isoleucine--tRNA ligase [Oscillospiraceae bacterium]
MDYNATMNLPKTDFPMRAGLPQREPEMIKKWQDEELYQKLMEKNKDLPLYVLHDGPPYANGDIHMGTALNKVLKDIIVKYKNMSGFKAPYVPGWDTHGLPIELKAMKKVGVENIHSAIELRKVCQEFAEYYVDVQRKQFMRLGSIGDYFRPYLTFQHKHEAEQIRIFGEMAKKDFIYKGLKPVYWCPECQTALAEAEIEYEEDTCHSIYVKFKVDDDQGKLAPLGTELDKTYFVIWTTTTWTLPGNLAICLGPEYEYVAVKANGEYYIMAKELVESAMKAAKIEEYTVSETSVKGTDLEYIVYKHPFIDRTGLVIVGDHVTLESGTGCVHTAPGHGVEDYEVCVNHYPEIPIIVPVDGEGKLTAEAGEFQGLTTGDANKAILTKLTELNALFAVEKIIHQYPHCWRCKSPIIFRATEQWFCSVDGFKEDACKAIDGVQWIPEWGGDRIKGMVTDRSDWCISRQRTWGVPIPIFYCKDCGKVIINETTIEAVASLFEKEGSDAWFKYEANEILPEGYKCECGCTEFTKDNNIMDVWFDSGVSHAAVCDEEHGLRWPADLYLEGADQYRGWFQSSLLTSVAAKGGAPYKAVCTHGWVVDGEGKAMHKSLGNGVSPDEVTEKYGADILRTWVASSDYHADIRISGDILKQLSDVYRKIRNTARFILSNLNDFDPDKDSVAVEKLDGIDKWALARMDEILDKCKAAYDKFDFHIVYSCIRDFCTTDLSNFYLDILKDRLYVEKADSESRRAAQTVIYNILRGMTLCLAPILSFTAEEIWGYLPRSEKDDAGSVFFNRIPEKSGVAADEEFMAKWEKIDELRDIVNKALEEARAQKLIGKSLEAKVTLNCGRDWYEFAKSAENDLVSAFIVSAVEIGTSEFDGVDVKVEVAPGEKCERCWTHSHTVGECAEHPTLCARCAEIVG